MAAGIDDGQAHAIAAGAELATKADTVSCGSPGAPAEPELPMLHRLAVVYLMLPVVVWLVGWFEWWLGLPAADPDRTPHSRPRPGRFPAGRLPRESCPKTQGVSVRATRNP